MVDENSGFTLLPPLEVINGTIIETNVTEFKRIKHGDIVRLGEWDFWSMVQSGRTDADAFRDP